MQQNVRNKYEDTVEDVDPLYISDEKECTDEDVSKTAISVKVTGERDENIAFGRIAGLLDRCTVREDLG